jgi:hypothetical protein
MRKFSTPVWSFVLLMMIFVPAASAQQPEKDMLVIQGKMDRVVSGLSSNITQLENLQNRLMELGRAKENYNEQKNIWLSSVLTLSAIQSICEYQSDLLTLFMDLHENKRKNFYAVRIESLDTSIQQINIMYRQIQISHALITHEDTERTILDKEDAVIQSILQLLKQSRDLIDSMKKQ